jgi:hypothetical protein
MACLLTYLNPEPTEPYPLRRLRLREREREKHTKTTWCECEGIEHADRWRWRNPVVHLPSVGIILEVVPILRVLVLTPSWEEAWHSSLTTTAAA